MKVQYKKHGTLQFYESECLFTVPHEPPPVLTGPFERCEGCPYPGHGFVCWDRSGETCLRTEVERAGWKVDYVITHCAPTSIVQQMNRHYQLDKLMDFLETVLRRCQFGKWFYSHYHINQMIDKRFVIQWEQISKIE